jgi:hypothetical protein
MVRCFPAQREGYGDLELLPFQNSRRTLTFCVFSLIVSSNSWCCRFSIILWFLGILSISQILGAFPAPEDFGDTNSFGYGIQRTMKSFTESTAESKRTVRMLLYGQSITFQPWWVSMTNTLLKRFPNVDLVVENRAIPGFTTEILVKTAEYDVYNFYPDLFYFQAYGSMVDYETIIAQVRARTTAEIMIQTEHPIHPEDLTESTDPSKIAVGTDAWRNYVALPEIAQKYGAELVDVRTPWKYYLTNNSYAPTNLLTDGIHLNEQGLYLMSELVGSHFRLGGKSVSGWSNSVHVFRIGEEIQWINGFLQLEFVGNRVDFVSDGSDGTPIDVLIDGRKPSTFPELYAFTRPSNYPNLSWPFAIYFRALSPQLSEDWTLTFLESRTNPAFVRFRVDGTEIGFEGEGNSSERFVSHSGRVIIDPQTWFALYLFGNTFPITPGNIASWKTVSLSRDRYQSVGSPADGIEKSTVIVQGLGNGHHVLTLTSGAHPAIEAIRVFSPAAMTSPAIDKAFHVSTVPTGSGFSLRIDRPTRYTVEKLNDAISGTWTNISAPQTSDFPIGNAGGAHFYRARRLE